MIEQLGGAMVIEPDAVMTGVILIAVPHMDDEALACAGTIARIRDKSRIHLVYATDGMRSPEPVLPWRDVVSANLGSIRRSESIAAMTKLGVPADNLHFLNLPEAELERHRDRLRDGLEGLLRRLRPQHVLAPFRFDRHRDHIAINAAVIHLAPGMEPSPQLWEYFVYHRWRLLPRRDIRAYIRPPSLCQVDIAAVAGLKRAALACFTTQTTRYYSWQSRPNLTATLLDAVSREPEAFVRYDAALPGAAILERLVPWIRLAHRLESPLKRKKDRAIAVWQRAWSLLA